MIMWLAGHAEVTIASVTFDDEDERLLPASLPRNVHIVHARPCMDGCSTAIPWQFRWAWSHELAEKISSLSLGGQFNAVIAEHSYAFPYIASLRGMPRLLTVHNIEYRVYKQFAGLELRERRKLLKLAGRAGNGFSSGAHGVRSLEAFEREVWQSADDIFCVSPIEQVEIARMTSARTHYIPNCGSGAVDSVMDKQAKRAAISFAGTLHYVPNIDTIVLIAEKIAPAVRQKIPELEVIVIGRDPTQDLIEYCSDRDVRVIANPVETGTLISNTAFVCPLRLGAGTRIKVLDARKNAVPVFTNSFALEGLDTASDPGVVVDDDMDHLCSAITSYLHSGSPRVELSAPTPQWQQVFSTLGSVFRSLHRHIGTM
jgi:polysaccharide biosynthesis protein PslH